MCSREPIHSPLTVIEDIVERIGQIGLPVGDLDLDTFVSTPQLLKAVLYDLLVIGEAVNRLSDDITRRHPDIPWNRVRGLRNRLVHAYWDVDPEIIWYTVTEHLNPLCVALEIERARLLDGPSTG